MNKEMDVGGQRENKRHMIDYYKPPLWNVISQYQTKEQNDFHVNAKLATLYDESNLALHERDRALAEKNSALGDRDLAIHQRDAAISKRDNALRERDNAIAALQFHESTMNSLSSGAGVRGPNRSNHPSKSARRLRDKCITDTFPVPVIQSGAKKITDEPIHFDESTMPVPVCSCTGVSRQCYKWGDGGWQSACCTNSLSVYPLPQIKKKKHMRMGGRKMSGSVFSRLLTRMAAAGHDLSIAVDLKSHWAKHGTNSYITIK